MTDINKGKKILIKLGILKNDEILDWVSDYYYNESEYSGIPCKDEYDGNWIEHVWSFDYFDINFTIEIKGEHDENIEYCIVHTSHTYTGGVRGPSTTVEECLKRGEIQRGHIIKILDSIREITDNDLCELLT